VHGRTVIEYRQAGRPATSARCFDQPVSCAWRVAARVVAWRGVMVHTPRVHPVVLAQAVR